MLMPEVTSGRANIAAVPKITAERSGAKRGGCFSERSCSEEEGGTAVRRDSPCPEGGLCSFMPNQFSIENKRR